MYKKGSIESRLWRRAAGVNADLFIKLDGLAMAVRGVRAYRRSTGTTRLAGPLCVQVQTIDRCNAACIMCPYSRKAASGVVNRMSDALYSRILAELAALGTTRIFTPMLQNEPLLDAGIALRIREARKALGARTFITLVTNGGLLNEERARMLSTSGLNALEFSIDAYREETYETIRKGLDFHRVKKNLHELLRRRDRPLVIARFLKQRANEGEERPFTLYWKAKGAGVFVHSVANRAGTLDRFDGLMNAGHTRSIKTPFHNFLRRMFPFCTEPFFNLNVLWDGRVILCCHDWGPAVVAGDLNEQTLSEIWNGERMNAYRYLLYGGKSREIPACRQCSRRWGPFKIQV